MKKIYSAFFFLILQFFAISQKPTFQPNVETKSLETNAHFEQYGKYYIIGFLVVLVALIVIYAFGLDKKIFKPKDED